jgi:two-component system nitrate/nitrite response regulator NarL
LISRSPGSSRHVDQGAAAAEALTLAETHRPNLITLDVGPQGEGLAALNELHEAQPRLKIVVLTASQSEARLIATLAASAAGYLLKGIGGAELVQRIRGIASGEIYSTPSLAVRMLTQLRLLSQPADS